MNTRYNLCLDPEHPAVSLGLSSSLLYPPPAPLQASRCAKHLTDPSSRFGELDGHRGIDGPGPAPASGMGRRWDLLNGWGGTGFTDRRKGLVPG